MTLNLLDPIRLNLIDRCAALRILIGPWSILEDPENGVFCLDYRWPLGSGLSLVRESQILKGVRGIWHSFYTSVTRVKVLL